MGNFIIEDFKNAWNKKDNGLIKIIIINIIVFVSMSILEVFFTLSNLFSGFFMSLIKKPHQKGGAKGGKLLTPPLSQPWISQERPFWLSLIF